MNKLIKVFSNSKGMSFVEMLVVVAIIAILALIAVPQFERYQARARQAEGINMLTGFYQAATTARAEFGRYPGNMVQTGWAPEGRINYRFHNNNNPSMPASTRTFDFACQGTAHPCNCAGGGSQPCPNFKTWTENLVPVAGDEIGATTINPFHSSACGSLPSTTVSSDNRFSARVAGRIMAGAPRDAWGIDEMRTLQNCSDGTLR